MRDGHTGANPTRSVSRRTYLQLGAGAGAVALAGCTGGGNGGGSETITYLNRGGVIQDAEQAVLEEWEEESGIEIEYQAAAQDTEMFDQISANPGSFDLVSLSPYGYALNEAHPDFAETDYLADIDYDQVPNYTDNIQEEWREIEFLQGHDKGLFYHISTQGLGYNTEDVGDISSWEDIKDDDLEGEVTLFDSAPTRFGNCCAALGYQPAEVVEDDDMYDEVVAEMEAQHQNVYDYWMAGNDFMTDLREGEASAASAWGGRVEALHHDGHPMAYTVPDEGCIQWSVAFSILEESDMKEEVYDLLNWIYQEDIAIDMVEQHYYPIPLEGDHETMEGRFESMDADDVVSFDWTAVMPHLAEIEQTFNEIKAGA
ncbi:extracellular solute-binding protein [Salinadaptatus halalkaliphilus]|uniref:Extracellular solute-binding protein n=1 Tax=Salinadaptatus halalkaliphilus TaxID=2419781 RepID=A0A4S3TLW3_9EURY|nr:extracellular solute-binding protein [Salinadaptatus halalkaliphilus]THE63618.1 extracellular solute-binding protein [Salinadaptatus halalkaliphilus]